jgi:tetratricopeptide (TPR) repeat protein
LPLYANAQDPFFQVGSDLLLLDRPAGAAHAFMRGIAAGESRMDHLYWLGWAELWRGSRDRAEATWKTFGALDDSLFHVAHLRAAHNALLDGDTLEARRHLIRAIEFGIGRPEGHAVLGELLLNKQPKYAMLELKVATWLQPRDWMALRALSLALVNARLDDQARQTLEALEQIYPEWRADTAVARARQTLGRRSAAGSRVARY